MFGEVLVRRVSRRTLVTILATVLLVIAAVAATFDLPGYVVAGLAAFGVLVPIAERVLSERMGRLRAHRAPLGAEQRAELLGRLRDQAAGDLAMRLAWVRSLGQEARSMPYRAALSGGEDVGDDAPTVVVEDLVGELLRWREVALLGDGGTGKSTLLRMTQECLLERAEKDAAAPIPIVLDVSTWTEEGGSFTDWVCRGVDELYAIPRGVVEEMIARAQVAILLDGIDELRTSARHDAARQLRLMLGGFRGRTIVASRPEEFAAIQSQLPLEHQIRLERLDTSVVGHVLARRHQDESIPVALADFVDTPFKLMMAAELLALPDGQLQDITSVDWANLVPTYVRRRLEDTSREGWGKPISPSEERGLEWVAAHLSDDGHTVVDPGAIPYSWAPRDIRLSALVGVPVVVGLVAGALSLLWLPPVAAGLVTSLVWLSYTTDVDVWFGRNPRLVLAACVLSAISAGAALYLLEPWLLVIGVVLLTLWIIRSRHYAPRYLLAAGLTNAVAAGCADAMASVTGPALLVVVVSGLTWVVVLVLAAAILFTPCGVSVKYHAGIEGRAPEGPDWFAGLAVGIDVAIWAGAAGVIPVLVVSTLCVLTGVAVGTGIAAVVAPTCAWLMVYTAMVHRAKIIDHGLPASIRYPLMTGVVLSPLLLLFDLLLDAPQKAMLGAPVFLVLYLALNFIRGSDAGVFRTSEGGAALRQLVYRSLLARRHVIPFRLRQLFDRASQRVLMRRAGTGDQYAFEHSLVRDCFAQIHRDGASEARPAG